MAKKVYVAVSTDIVHGGHIALIKNAATLGDVIIGLFTDEAVASYKRYPLLDYNERKKIFEDLKEVKEIVPQTTLSFKENLLKYKPDYVVHGDNWKEGPLAPVRAEVVEVLKTYGGELVEFPYSRNPEYQKLDAYFRDQSSLPDIRRGKLKKLLAMKPIVTAMEAHSGLTGLIVEKTVVYEDGGARQFDAMWSSSLCDSTDKAKPDIELVDMTSRFQKIDEIMEVTTKPIIYDGDTGGKTEHFVYMVRTLERMGVSAVIIEDKTGLKKNSLFGTEVQQTQDTIENFCHKIQEGEKVKRTNDFMIIARCESLILEKGMEDALKRCRAYVDAGVDGIMIHSRKKDPAEIFEFCDEFRRTDPNTPIIVVPTSFSQCTTEELASHGINLAIYANQMMRAAFPAMQKTAEEILKNHRSEEVEGKLMPFKDIIRLIDELE